MKTEIVENDQQLIVMRGLYIGQVPSPEKTEDLKLYTTQGEVAVDAQHLRRCVVRVWATSPKEAAERLEAENVRVRPLLGYRAEGSKTYNVWSDDYRELRVVDVPGVWVGWDVCLLVSKDVGLTFSAAMKALLEDGWSVRRTSWPPMTDKVGSPRPRLFTATLDADTHKRTPPTVYLGPVNAGEMATKKWSPEQEDFFATDWEVNPGIHGFGEEGVTPGLRARG